MMDRRREKLEHLEQMRFALGYGAILQRGFALVRNDEGVVRSALQAPAGTRLSVQFFDGRITATADGPLDETAQAAKPTKRREPTPKKKPEGGQGSLFLSPNCLASSFRMRIKFC